MDRASTPSQIFQDARFATRFFLIFGWIFAYISKVRNIRKGCLVAFPTALSHSVNLNNAPNNIKILQHFHQCLHSPCQTFLTSVVEEKQVWKAAISIEMCYFEILQAFCDDIGDVLNAMFPVSEIAKIFSCALTKCSCEILFGWIM